MSMAPGQLIEKVSSRWVVGLSVVLMFLLSGCAASYSGSMSHLLKDLEKGDYQGALDKLKDPPKKNKLLYHLEKGLILHYQGQYEASNWEFAEAERISDELFTRSISRQAASMLSSDRVIPYRGEEFELSLIHYYRAMNYARLGDRQAALVECRKANQKLEDHAQQAEYELSYKNDAFLQYMTGLFFESEEEWNDAYISYKDALKGYRAYEAAFGSPVPRILLVDLARLAEYLGYEDEVQKYVESYQLTPEELQPVSGGEIVVFVETGFVPRKHQIELNMPIMMPLEKVVRTAVKKNGEQSDSLGEPSAIVVEQNEERPDRSGDPSEMAAMMQAAVGQLDPSSDDPSEIEAQLRATAEQFLESDDPGELAAQMQAEAEQNREQSDRSDDPNGVVAQLQATVAQLDSSGDPSEVVVQMQTVAEQSGEQPELLGESSEMGAEQNEEQSDSPTEEELAQSEETRTIAEKAIHRYHHPHLYQQLGVDYWLRVAMPEYREVPTQVAEVRLRAGNQGTTAVVGEDLSAIAQQTLSDKFDSILSRAVLRGVVKYLASKGVEKIFDRGQDDEDDEDDKDDKKDDKKDKDGNQWYEGETTGEMLGGLTNLALAALEKADTRNWLSLPHTIYIARLSVPPGTTAPTVELIGTQGGVLAAELLPEVAVPAGEKVFLNFRTFR